MAVATPPRSSRNGHKPSLPPELATQLLRIPLESIDVGDNVRVNIAELEELTASIVEHGVLQPVKAVEQPGGRYRLVWGQRRVLAARKAGLTEIPAIVELEHLDVADAGATRSIEQLVENLHRADLNPIDRARAMKDVVGSGISQADLARTLGIGASTVANDLRLLEASPAVHDALAKGAITASHAKAMLPLPLADQENFVKRVTGGGLSTHRLEEEVGWKLQTLRADELWAERATKQTPKLLAALEAANVSKDTLVAIRTPYNIDQGRLEPAVARAGWKLVERGTYARQPGPASKCDCAVVVVEFNRSWKVQPACIDDRHRDRQNNVNRDAEEKRRKAIAAKVDRLEALIERVLEATAIPAPLLKLITAVNLHDFPRTWAGSVEATRGQLAHRLAMPASSEYAYGESRPIHDALLDEVLATFEALVAGTEAKSA